MPLLLGAGRGTGVDGSHLFKPSSSPARTANKIHTCCTTQQEVTRSFRLLNRTADESELLRAEGVSPTHTARSPRPPPSEAQHVTRAPANSRELPQHLAALHHAPYNLPSTSYRDTCRNRGRTNAFPLREVTRIGRFPPKKHTPIFHSQPPQFNRECFRFRREAFHKKAVHIGLFPGIFIHS